MERVTLFLNLMHSVRDGCGVADLPWAAAATASIRPYELNSHRRLHCKKILHGPCNEYQWWEFHTYAIDDFSVEGSTPKSSKMSGLFFLIVAICI
uniref:Uncharacterized protein n=1 Tax=Leersia perrieri TaxID=77586 RepID=A0A0D9XG38_9ORYZ